MPSQAKITSIEALDSFRIELIIYLDKAKRCLDEVAEEVTHTRQWLQNDRWPYWEAQVRRRTHQLEERQLELSNARLSVIPKRTLVEQMAVEKAKRSLREAETKLDFVKQWNRHYDSRVEPLAKTTEKLRHALMSDMRHAVAWLAQAAKTLDAYAEVGVRRPSGPSAPSEKENRSA